MRTAASQSAALDAGAVLIQNQPGGTVQYWLPGDALPAWSTPPVLPVQRLISAAEFRDRFTAAELAATSALAYSGTGDVPAQLLLLKVSTNRDGIDLDSAETIGGLDYLVSKGVLPAARKAAILA